MSAKRIADGTHLWGSIAHAKSRPTSRDDPLCYTCVRPCLHGLPDLYLLVGEDDVLHTLMAVLREDLPDRWPRLVCGSIVGGCIADCEDVSRRRADSGARLTCNDRDLDACHCRSLLISLDAYPGAARGPGARVGAGSPRHCLQYRSGGVGWPASQCKGDEHSRCHARRWLVSALARTNDELCVYIRQKRCSARPGLGFHSVKGFVRSSDRPLVPISLFSRR